MVAERLVSGRCPALADALQPEHEGILLGERVKVEIHRELRRSRRHGCSENFQTKGKRDGSQLAESVLWHVVAPPGFANDGCEKRALLVRYCYGGTVTGASSRLPRT